jgi:hypothetical protein
LLSLALFRRLFLPFDREAVSAKTFKYSPTGRQFAYVHGST